MGGAAVNAALPPCRERNLCEQVRLKSRCGARTRSKYGYNLVMDDDIWEYLGYTDWDYDE